MPTINGKHQRFHWNRHLSEACQPGGVCFAFLIIGFSFHSFCVPCAVCVCVPCCECEWVCGDSCTLHMILTRLRTNNGTKALAVNAHNRDWFNLIKAERRKRKKREKWTVARMERMNLRGAPASAAAAAAPRDEKKNKNLGKNDGKKEVKQVRIIYTYTQTHTHVIGLANEQRSRWRQCQQQRAKLAQTTTRN